MTRRRARSLVHHRPTVGASSKPARWCRVVGESTACILRPWPRRGRFSPGYFFFICSPQQISECGIPGGQGHPFSYTNSAPHFSQT